MVRGRGRKNMGRIMAVSYLTQFQRHLLQPAKRLTEMEAAVLTC